MKNESRAKGVMLSYITTAVRTVSRLLLTPLYLRFLGVEEYGFYQYVFSIAVYATILDFGISSVINKFGIECRERNDKAGEENVMFYTLVFAAGAVCLIGLMGLVVGIAAPTIFGETVVNRLALTRWLLVFMIGELIMLMFQHFFEGVILSEERYVTHRAVALAQVILRALLTIVFLIANMGVMSIALGDFFGVGLCLAYEIVFCKKKLHLKVRYHGYDPVLIRSIAKLSLALCLQSVVSYLNSSVNQFVLGRSLSTAAVTIYSIALTFSSFFDEIPTVIQRLYLPQVVKLVTSGTDGEELTDFVIKPGRIQFILVGGILGGFVLFGRQFITMWSGEETLEAWIIALFLMVPSVLPLIQNVCLSILTAMNKRMFRSYAMFGIAVVNLIIAVILVRNIGVMGAAIANAVSLILGNNIAMNIYYKRVIHINVGRLFKSIFKGILPCAILATALCAPLLLVNAKGLVWFVVQCGIFCVVYAALLLLFGANKEEKNQVFVLVRKFTGK